jgi:hypothetical protein
MFKLSIEEQRDFIQNCIKEVTIYEDDIFVSFMFRDMSENSDNDSKILDNQKHEHLQNANIRAVVTLMVPKVGIEPTHPKIRDFESLVSTNSTI